MVHLETFACFVCSKQCMPDFDGHQTGKSGRIGIYCHDLFIYYAFCGTCSKKGLAIVENGLLTDNEYSASLENVLPAVAYLANVAPGEELKLLNFGKWNPNVCVYCNSPTALAGLCIVNCLKCKVHEPEVLDFFRKVLNELSSFFLNVPYEPVERKATLVLTDFFSCSKCRKEATGFSSSGSLYCDLCRKGVDHHHIDPKMLWNFNQLLRCVPDTEDLGLLTFSKWTPFRCDKCSIPFTSEPSRFPHHHSVCAAMCCRLCFDNYGCCMDMELPLLIPLPFIVAAARKLQFYLKDISLAPESYENGLLSNEENQIVVNPILPQNARCACGRVEDVDQLFECSDCSSAGFCAVCLFDNHWKHDVCRIKPRMLRTVVRENSDKTLGKLLSWIERTKELHSHSIEVFADLIDLLGKLYRMAMYSEDEHFVAGLLADADVSMFEAEFERLADEKEKVITKMCQFRDVLRKRLMRDDRLTMERP